MTDKLSYGEKWERILLTGTLSHFQREELVKDFVALEQRVEEADEGAKMAFAGGEALADELIECEQQVERLTNALLYHYFDGRKNWPDERERKMALEEALASQEET